MVVFVRAQTDVQVVIREFEVVRHRVKRQVPAVGVEVLEVSDLRPHDCPKTCLLPALAHRCLGSGLTRLDGSPRDVPLSAQVPTITSPKH